MNMIADLLSQHGLEIVGSLLGFLYLFFELKAHKAMFPTGILMSLFYAGVFYDSQFYAYACINIYFVLAQIYAWWKWSMPTDSPDMPMRHLRPIRWIPIGMVTLLLFAGIWWLLIRLPHEVSTLAWGDSLITALSMVAIGMLAQRYVEQWLPLIVANAFSVGLFYAQGLYPTTVLYLVYLVASFVGYRKWSKMVKKPINTNNSTSIPAH